MRREIAAELVAQYLAFREIFNRITELSLQIDDATEAKAVRHLNANAFDSFDEIVRIVGRKFPDLVPED